MMAITLHNIPEGLAVESPSGRRGGSALGHLSGPQPWPWESVCKTSRRGGGLHPLAPGGLSRFRSFWYGQLSGIVEPMAAVLGAWAALLIRPSSLRPLLRRRRHGLRRRRELIPEAQEAARLIWRLWEPWRASW